MTRKQEELSYKILQHIVRSLRSNKDEIDEYLHTETIDIASQKPGHPQMEE